MNIQDLCNVTYSIDEDLKSITMMQKKTRSESELKTHECIKQIALQKDSHPQPSNEIRLKRKFLINNDNNNKNKKNKNEKIDKIKNKSIVKIINKLELEVVNLLTQELFKKNKLTKKCFFFFDKDGLQEILSRVLDENYKGFKTRISESTKSKIIETLDNFQHTWISNKMKKNDDVQNDQNHQSMQIESNPQKKVEIICIRTIQNTPIEIQPFRSSNLEISDFKLLESIFNHIKEKKRKSLCQSSTFFGKKGDLVNYLFTELQNLKPKLKQEDFNYEINTTLKDAIGAMVDILSGNGPCVINIQSYLHR